MLTASEVEMKLVDTSQSGDTVLNNIFVKQFSHIEKKPHGCLCPLPVIPLLGIIPMKIQQQQKAIYKKMLSVIYKSSNGNINGQH